MAGLCIPEASQTESAEPRHRPCPRQNIHSESAKALELIRAAPQPVEQVKHAQSGRCADGNGYQRYGDCASHQLHRADLCRLNPVGHYAA
jgi:hypothetical protein